MGSAFAWGTLGGSSLVIRSLVAVWFQISLRWIGLIMACGAGVLISAVAFDLVQEAAETSSGTGGVAIGMLAGCAVFFGEDLLIVRLGGAIARVPTATRRAARRWPSPSTACSTASRSRW